MTSAPTPPTPPTPEVSFITLGVTDVERAARFYEKLGLKRSGFTNADIVFFDLGRVALAVFQWSALANDAEVAPEGMGFRGVALAWNLPSEAEVDLAMGRALAAGGRMVKPAHKVFWGGYSGYFADPDDHLWEIAYNPIWPTRPDGSVALPPPKSEV